MCLWSHLEEGGSRGVEFVRNPRPKFFKNSLTQVNATSCVAEQIQCGEFLAEQGSVLCLVFLVHSSKLVVF